jgi:hypothetical protein
MAPRTECACQPVAFITSAMVAPPLRCRRLRSKASLVPERSAAGDAVLFSFERGAAVAFDLLALRARPADRFESRGAMLSGVGRLCSSVATLIACRPASVMTSVKRWPSLPSRQAAALSPVGFSSSRPFLSRFFRTWLTAPPWSLSDLGSGKTVPSSRWPAVERMMSWVSVSLGMGASFGVLRRGHRGASTIHSPAGRAGRGG